jgi:uncharacterized protein
MKAKNGEFSLARAAISTCWPAIIVSIGLPLLDPAQGLADAPSPTPATSVATPLPIGKITLDATARRRLPNTVADVTLAVELEGRTSDEVSAAHAQRSQTLLDYLREQSVERLRTDISISPRTETVHGEPDRIVGFYGQTFVSFRTTADKLGKLLAGSLQHGANTVSQTEFFPLQSEVDTARQELAIEAAKSALQRADTLAQAIGERVVRIESVDVESEEGIKPLRMQAARAAQLASSSPAALPTVAGEQEIVVKVSVQVAIDRNVH